MHKSELALSKGVKLFHLWNHFGADKVFELMLSKCGAFKNKIFARQTTFSQISAKEAKPFLESNHVHGFLTASFYFALTLNSKVVQILTFRRIDDFTIELSRLATLSNTAVIGGSEKLFKHALPFLRQAGFKTIISYAYRDLTPDPDDSVYSRLGFTFKGFTEPGMSFYVQKKFTCPDGSTISEGVYSRNFFQNQKMLGRGYTSFTQSDLKSLGVYRVFDSGNLRFEYLL